MDRPLSHTLIALACASGCYAPTTAENLPCSENGECPDGQLCAPATQRCVVMLPSPDAPRDAPIDASAIDVAPDAATLAFSDDFDRASGPEIGNAWIEKTPLAFSLVGGEVARNPTTGTNYRDHLVYRPATEKILDVEISIDVRVTAVPTGTPQLFVRGVLGSIAGSDSYTGYLLYGSAGGFVLGRQEGQAFVTTLSGVTISESLTVGPTYRLTLRAVGSSPVTLTARIERMSVNGPVLLGLTVVMDTAPTQITELGTVGFSGDSDTPYVYDRFRRTPL